MPFSHNRFDEHMKIIIAQAGGDSWLDIGAGTGKHGKMLRNILPDAHTTGVEIETDYIDKYGLTGKYDVVRPISAIRLMNEPRKTYDGIILGDVIEHMPKSQGVNLINFLVYRCKIMIIIYPIKRIQNDYKGYKHEPHISVWGEEDWLPFDCTLIDNPASHLVVIDGYIEHERFDAKCLMSIT